MSDFDQTDTEDDFSEESSEHMCELCDEEPSETMCDHREGGRICCDCLTYCTKCEDQKLYTVCVREWNGICRDCSESE